MLPNKNDIKCQVHTNKSIKQKESTNIMNTISKAWSSESVFVDLIPHGKCFTLIYEFNVLASILLIVLKANTSKICIQ